MPKVPSWYVRVPEILKRLRAAGAPPLLDRAAVEDIFGVRRRQAIRLLASASGYQVGKTFIIEREALVQFLERVEHSGAARQAVARKQRVAVAINEVENYLEAQRVEIESPRGRGVPAAVELVAPGKLQISYDGPEDLLARIVELASAAANDFGAFRKLYGTGK